MSLLKKIFVYGGFIAFVFAILFSYIGMNDAAIVACFLFAPGYFITMSEVQRDRDRHNFNRGRAAALKGVDV